MNQDKFDIEYEGSLILTDTCINGNLKSEKSICLEGRIEGNVHSGGRMIINKHAEVDGNVECAELFTNGLITGNVSVTNKAVVGVSAIIQGSLIASVLEITSGAKIRGGLKLGKASNKK